MKLETTYYPSRNTKVWSRIRKDHDNGNHRGRSEELVEERIRWVNCVGNRWMDLGGEGGQKRSMGVRRKGDGKDNKNGWVGKRRKGEHMR